MNVIGADPHVMYDEKSGYYYCYATSGDSDTGKYFYIYKSKDLVEWEKVGYALDTSINCWGKDWYWAPECYYNPNNEMYYLFYSARINDDLVEEHFENKNYYECAKIGVAVSKSPEGPFINICNKPIDYFPFDKDYLDVDQIYENIFDVRIKEEDLPKGIVGQYIGTIDVNLFFEDERIIMYFSRCCYKNARHDKVLNKFIEESHVCAVELNTEWWFDKDAKMMPTIKEKFINQNNLGTIHRRDGFINIINHSNQPQEWEDGHVNDYELSGGKSPNRRWFEGSTTFTKIINDKKHYFVLYSCNYYVNELYGVGIAYNNEPLGFFTKFKRNPIIKQNPIKSLYSTGHGCLVEKNGESYYVFHGRETKTADRVIYVGKININSEEDVYVSDIKQCKLVSF